MFFFVLCAKDYYKMTFLFVYLTEIELPNFLVYVGFLSENKGKAGVRCILLWSELCVGSLDVI
jgi:hypothetical protein